MDPQGLPPAPGQDRRTAGPAGQTLLFRSGVTSGKTQSPPRQREGRLRHVTAGLPSLSPAAILLSLPVIG